MKKYAVAAALLCASFNTVFAATVSVAPTMILEGDPVMLTMQSSSSPKTITFDKKLVPSFVYGGTPHALFGIDLKKPAGNYPLTIQFQNGESIQTTITVAKRDRPEEPLGIPQKLGGNTTGSQTALVDSLAIENASLAKIYSIGKATWKTPFIAPVAEPVITDPYGYDRKTGEYTIAHKGTDFRAPAGTKVTAMNRGVVRIARTYRVYGKTIVVDHGLGVHTFYMHLSKIYVNVGELVERGQLIGLSGETGYAERPHLHVSVHINGIAIDPVKFLALFGANL